MGAEVAPSISSGALRVCLPNRAARIHRIPLSRGIAKIVFAPHEIYARRGAARLRDKRRSARLARGAALVPSAQRPAPGNIRRRMFIVDAHLDLAYNVMRGRDITRPAAEQPVVDNEVATIGLPDLRRGGVGMICATIFCPPRNYKNRGYTTADEA